MDDVALDRDAVEAFLKGRSWFRGVHVDLDDGGAHLVVLVHQEDVTDLDPLVYIKTNTKVCYVLGKV